MNSDLKATQRIAKLTPLVEVLRKIDALVTGVTPREVALETALGRVLAADAISPASLPEHAIALRDGWAVRADEIADASSYLPVTVELGPQWVETGQPMPTGADSVLPPDALAMNELKAEALAPAASGDGVLPAGGDMKARTTLRCAGERLRAIDCVILQSAGVTEISVREPKILVVRANSYVHDGGDFISPFVMRFLDGCGGRTKVNVQTSLEAAVNDEEVDALIVLGGSGTGRSDKSVLTLARIGHLEVHGIAIQPGETAALGTSNGRPVLIVPGRFDAALSTLLIIGRRMLARLTCSPEGDPSVAVRLSRKFASQVGIAEFIPMKCTENGAIPLASRNIPFRALSEADGWILIPAESEGYAAGTLVEMRLLP